MTQQKKNYVLPIAMMFALFAMISFVTGLTNPLGLIVKEQFQAANWMTQLGNAANFIAYAFMGLPAGMMLKRIGYKKTALTAVAVGFIGVGIQVLSGQMDYQPGELTVFWVYLTGAFVSGFSMCMLNAVVNPLLNTLAGGGKKGNQLIQFGGSLNSISATIVPVLGGYLIGTISQDTRISDANPALFIAMGIFAVVFIVLVRFTTVASPTSSSRYFFTISVSVRPLSGPLATTDSLFSTPEISQLSPTPFKSSFRCLNGIILSPPQSVCFRMGSNFNGYIFVFLVINLD